MICKKFFYSASHLEYFVSDDTICSAIINRQKGSIKNAANDVSVYRHHRDSHHILLTALPLSLFVEVIVGNMVVIPFFILIKIKNRAIIIRSIIIPCHVYYEAKLNNILYKAINKY